MARKTEGRLFKRNRSKFYWADFTVDGKRFRSALRDANGARVTNKAVAQRLLEDIVNPLKLHNKAEQFRQLADTVKSFEQKTAEALDVSKPPLKIIDAWDTFINAANRPDSGDRTLSDYKGYFKAFEKWVSSQPGEITYMRDINRETAGKYAAYLTSSGKSANTFNKHSGFMKMFYRVLEDQARITENPFAKITRKKLKTESRRELTIEELYRVLNEREGDLALLLSLGTFTGLRLGDCCTLHWGEVDLVKRVIRRIPNKTASKNPKPVLIGIPAPLYDLLIKIPRKQRKGFLLPKLANIYNDVNKRPNITRKIQAHFEACDIQTQKPGTGKNTKKRAVLQVGFHSLRHTYVSLHAEGGTPQAIIQGNVGHGSPAMTRHYTHIGEIAARNVAEVLELPFNSNSQTVEPEREQLIEIIRTADIGKIKKVIKLLQDDTKAKKK